MMTAMLLAMKNWSTSINDMAVIAKKKLMTASTPANKSKPRLIDLSVGAALLRRNG
jgi:hypothetical protein